MSDDAIVRVAAVTHRGRVRDHNEDALVIGDWVCQDAEGEIISRSLPLSAPVVIAVCDGMGGHASGEVASSIAASLLARSAAGLVSEDAVANLLYRINSEVYLNAADSPARAGMGTTVAGVVLSCSGIIAFNVGDSRLYEVRNGFLRLISLDDTRAPSNYVYDPRFLAQANRSNNRITQSLGGAQTFSEIFPHVQSFDLPGSKRYLMCTDGLTDMLDLSTIEHCIVEEPIVLVTGLLEKALDQGAKDNISIAYIDFQPDESRSKV